MDMDTRELEHPSNGHADCRLRAQLASARPAGERGHDECGYHAHRVKPQPGDAITHTPSNEHRISSAEWVSSPRARSSSAAVSLLTQRQQSTASRSHPSVQPASSCVHAAERSRHSSRTCQPITAAVTQNRARAGHLYRAAGHMYASATSLRAVAHAIVACRSLALLVVTMCVYSRHLRVPPQCILSLLSCAHQQRSDSR